MRTTVFLWLLKLLTQRTCIFLNSACYLSTTPWARLCLEWTLLITSWKKCRDCQREQPCLSCCLERQAVAIRFPRCSIPLGGREEEGLRGLGVETFWRVLTWCSGVSKTGCEWLPSPLFRHRAHRSVTTGICLLAQWPCPGSGQLSL